MMNDWGGGRSVYAFFGEGWEGRGQGEEWREDLVVVEEGG